MALINVRYVSAESLTEEEKVELDVVGVEKGLIAIKTTNPEIKHKGVKIPNDDYVTYLQNLE